MSYQVEIIGPSGSVHYRMPISHPMILEALKTPGYSVRWPGCRDMAKLSEISDGARFDCVVTFPLEGMTASYSEWGK